MGKGDKSNLEEIGLIPFFGPRATEALDLLAEAKGFFLDLARSLSKDEQFEQDQAHNERLREQVRERLDARS
jgi:hypothetical protein